MSDDTRRVLDLVAQGKITVDDAAELLSALKRSPVKDDVPIKTDMVAAAAPAKPRFLRIAVHKHGREGRSDKNVNIRVPMAILRSGMRLGAIVPGFARDRMHARLRDQGMDIDLTQIDPAMIESLLADLGEVNIDVNQGEEQIRITCE
jgi:hypothetical protein